MTGFRLLFITRDKGLSKNHWGEERGKLKQKLSFSSLHTSAPEKSFLNSKKKNFFNFMQEQIGIWKA